MKKTVKTVMMGLLSLGSTVCAAQSLYVCASASYSIPSAENVPSATYQWMENGVVVPDATDASYTNATGKEEAGAYVYVRRAHTEACGWQNSNTFIVYVRTAPNSTVNFTAFDPCPDAEIGTEWYLQDTRESDNNQTYTVRKMADGRIWMVQDMKFGNLCGTDLLGSSTVTGDQTGKVTTLIDKIYYGDCTTSANTATPVNRGYLYDWAAAINKAGALEGSTSNVGCSGTTTAANACQGICPEGWHIPTGGSSGEFNNAKTKFQSTYGCSTDACWNASSQWEGTLGGYYEKGALYKQGSDARYWSSTYFIITHSYTLYFYSNSANAVYMCDKYNGRTVRCVRNYQNNIGL
jgi:uncharacterized protein (TIGR02145 family)